MQLSALAAALLLIPADGLDNGLCATPPMGFNVTILPALPTPSGSHPTPQRALTCSCS